MTCPMNILIIHPHDIWSDYEPWTSRVRSIAGQLVQRGHRVRLVYFHHVGGEERQPPQAVFESYPLVRAKRALFHNIAAVVKQAAWADIIHVQKALPYAVFPALYAQVLTGKPLHYDWDDWEWQIYEAGAPVWGAGWYLRMFENRLPRLADTVTVASSALAARARALGVLDGRLFMSPVCVDLDLFNPVQNGDRIRKRFEITKPLIMYVGQLHDAQYASLLIDALKHVCERHDVHCMFVGGGSREGELIRAVLANGLSRHVTFAGSVSHAEIPQYLAAADIAIACFENNAVTRCKSPLKIVEYMAAGKAIVASDVGDVRTMLGDAGLCVAPGDARALAAGIEQLLTDVPLRVSLESRARRRAEERFSWDTTINNLLCAYRRAQGLKGTNG